MKVSMKDMEAMEASMEAMEAVETSMEASIYSIKALMEGS